MNFPAPLRDCSSKLVRWSPLWLLLLGAPGCGGAAGASESELANGRNQAATGSVIYERSCQDCHGANGEGTDKAPAILGKKRLTKRFANAQRLYDYVAEKMPHDSPGSLDLGQYWNVVTFIVATHRRTIPDDRLSEGNASDVKLKD